MVKKGEVSRCMPVQDLPHDKGDHHFTDCNCIVIRNFSQMYPFSMPCNLAVNLQTLPLSFSFQCLSSWKLSLCHVCNLANFKICHWIKSSLLPKGFLKILGFLCLRKLVLNSFTSLSLPS
jgi:hypothetical protein